jgi:hypothetical protein
MGAEAGSFYEWLGEGHFRTTDLTATPWGTGSQHGGQPTGVGLARTTIHDPVLGPVGAAAQSLLVAER